MNGKELYLTDPCGTASLPYWKAKQTAIPEHMKIVHQRDFDEEQQQDYVDELYFRLLHDMRGLTAPIPPQGFMICTPSVKEMTAHVNECYGTRLPEQEFDAYRNHAVYAPDLWIALRESRTGCIAASGLAELDCEVSEGVLEWIQVSETWRGRGLGTWIVQELLWRLRGKAQFVTVSGLCENPTNPEALYRSCGFSGNDVWHVMRRK